ncbi:MAG: type VII secretion protein EssC [Clostridiales bacterium]|nr:type VII secretion protein EssC [Clostridiales bacterium]
MALAVCFRYKEREYYKELGIGEEISFGCHKKDHVQIPNTKEHMLWLKGNSDDLAAAAVWPLHLRSPRIECNEINILNQEMGSLLYVSRTVRRSSKGINLPYNGRITVGRSNDNDIMITYPVISRQHFQFLLEAGTVHVEDLGSTNGLYLNGKKISKAMLKSGDVLSILTFHFILENGILYFENIGSSMTISDRVFKMDRPAEPEARMPRPEKRRAASSPSAADKGANLYPRYQLSPRVREQLPHEPILLSGAPGKGPMLGSRRSNFAYLISSGAMMAASLATGMISPATLLMRAAGMISPITNMAMYGKMSKEEKKQVEEYEKMRQERYQAYIDSQKARIAKVADVQRRIVTAENPAPRSCMDTVQYLKRNLWERMPADSDFLTLRLGLGKDRLCVEVKSHANMDGFSMVDDELEELAGKIIEETRYVDNIPIRVSLREHQTIGIVGPKEATYYLIRNMLVELTAAHNGKDVHLVGMFEKDSRKYWKEFRWLPHIWDESGQVRYIAFDEERRHTISELLTSLIRTRKSEARGENWKKTEHPLPHYVIVVENEELLLAENVYDDLVSNNPSLGMTTIILADSMYELPQTCQFCIDLSEKPYAFEREKYDERLYFKMDEPVHSGELSTFARRMAAIEMRDRKTEAPLPSSITFLQGYDVQRAEELDVLTRWEKSEPYRTLEAPIGMMAGKKIFSLNVLDGDQAHGPHGLLAGTTGSGKSELLQTWILSMAVTYHPHDVNFVIIDYKGGGMSDLMEPLPHVVGKITNIDRNISRSLVSLKSELKRRQRLFAECEVNNITKYQKAYKSGLAKVPLPHLIIVTDEFAEMKKEEPEFMTELNTVATIGRTLGVHMLLATQKPAGVVTDQINANSRFRICMKIQDVADSREMLNRPDAARITQAGRAYIRVGEDELFELFQSFYSAAEYSEKIMEDKMKLENQVRIVGVTGNRISPVPKRKKKAEEMDELTAVIRYINKACKQRGIEKMAGPWLPELPRWLTFEELGLLPGFDGERWMETGEELKIPIGKYDIPQNQMQGVMYINLTETGHFGIYGSPSTGKTFLLKRILMSLGMYCTPKQVQITMIDAGKWELKEFAEMPHVRELILSGEKEKIYQFIKRIMQEMETRKNAFLKHAVSSLSAYREAVDPDLPAIVIVVEQMKPLFDAYVEMEPLMNHIAGSGQAFGIYLVYTATGGISVSYNLAQKVKGAITLQQPEKGNYTEIVGSVKDISVPQFEGRALMRGNPPVAFQTAVYADAQKDQERNGQVKEILRKMTEAWNALRKEEVKTGNGAENRAEPEESTEEKIPYDRRTDIPAGTYWEDMEPAYLNLAKKNICLICCEEQEKGREYLDRLENVLRRKEDNLIIRLTERNSGEEIGELAEKLNEKQKRLKEKKQEPDFDQEKWINGYRQMCILIENLPEFSAKLEKEDLKRLSSILRKSAGLATVILVSGTKEGWKEQEKNVAVNAALQAECVVITDGNPVEYTVLDNQGFPASANTILDEDEAVLLQNKEFRFIRY